MMVAWREGGAHPVGRPSPSTYPERLGRDTPRWIGGATRYVVPIGRYGHCAEEPREPWRRTKSCHVQTESGAD